VRTGLEGGVGLCVGGPGTLFWIVLRRIEWVVFEGGEGDFESVLRNLESLGGAAAVFGGGSGSSYRMAT
jgi:hypothetical protein